MPNHHQEASPENPSAAMKLMETSQSRLVSPGPLTPRLDAACVSSPAAVSPVDENIAMTQPWENSGCECQASLIPPLDPGCASLSRPAGGFSPPVDHFSH
jgi:hypothetical protein